MRPLSRVRFCLCCSLISFLVSPPVSAANRASRTTGQKGTARKSAGRVQTGLDVLEAEKFAPLRGKHVGVVTNHTGVDFQGRTNIELLARSSGVQLVAVFAAPSTESPATPMNR